MKISEAIKIVEEMNPEERAYYMGIREALFWNSENGKKQRIPWEGGIPGVEEFYLNPRKFWAILTEHGVDYGGWMWYWQWEIIRGEIQIELRCTESEEGIGDWGSPYYPSEEWRELWNFGEWMECVDVMKEKRDQWLKSYEVNGGEEI